MTKEEYLAIGKTELKVIELIRICDTGVALTAIRKIESLPLTIEFKDKGFNVREFKKHMYKKYKNIEIW